MTIESIMRASINIQNNPTQTQVASEDRGSDASAKEAVGRNDLCPCGSGKKYKKCGMLNTLEHQENMAKKK
jgi:uncharacterized protein YecA (UPF0149 family)